MAIIKCKMCGGDMELAADKTFGTCEYCGSTMTLPKVDDEHRAAAFNRGNHFRRIGEFDKALAVYERIVRENDTDAEAHWCCALCRFGIEYVEDPVTLEYLPTCHRASFDSFLEDVDYQAALEHSDGLTRRQYMKDGAKIAEVQRGILATSQNAEPYDVFICYKESDENGDRTRDSLMAQEIYYQLTEQGRKVFFARITLEDVVGTQYEPYIFAALNSAKVMIVVGTKPEHLNAVWVKNEWSRFLAMMKKDRSKLLLPCYRDMDPYDMPEQLSVLQSYDMGKIGFIQDLIRGVAKVLDVQKKPAAVKETAAAQQNAAPANNTAPLLKRVFLFLEDGDWVSANEYCEKVLDMDPECAEAYLGKLMAELQVRRKSDLKDLTEPFDELNNYQKALRFADENLKNFLTGYAAAITVNQETARKDAVYEAAMRLSAGHWIPDYQAAIRRFETIPGWRDSDEQIAACRAKIAAIKKKDAARAKRRWIITLVLMLIIGAVVGFRRYGDQLAALDFGSIFSGEKYVVGEYIKIGTYEQDNDKSNGPEPIEWLVLANEDGKVLLISKYALAAKPLNQKYENVPWQASSLYKWLNNEFLNDSFSEGERASISEVTLLSTKEAAKYFDSLGSRMCQGANSETNMNLATSPSTNTCSWWLRSPSDSNKVWYAVVDSTGSIDTYGTTVNNVNTGVRPVIWIDLTDEKNDTPAAANDSDTVQAAGQAPRVYQEITLGTYEQDNNPSNGREPIEWIVLAEENGRALVVSKYALDCKPFGGTTWESCSLRRWLNEDFLNEAFTEEEKAMIPTVTVEADAVTYYSPSGSKYNETRDPGENTQDRLFLLSASELQEYFGSIIERTCQASEYAKAQGTYVSSQNNNCWWWLRSSVAEGEASVAYDHGGYERYGGYGGNVNNIGVRPAIWIKLDE